LIDYHGRFVWYELITTDTAAAKAFYARVMGWETQDLARPGLTYTVFFAGRDPACGLMELAADARKMGAAPTWLGYVGVDDVDAAADRIRRLGGAVHVPPTDVPGFSRFSIVADPQMATLALVRWHDPNQQRPVEPGKPGRVGWHELLAADCDRAVECYREFFGWQPADAESGPTGPYRLFSVGGLTIGGTCTKPSVVLVPLWLYYFTVGDIDAAAERVRANGGHILDGPFEMPGGIWIARCTDPQGAMFALEGKRSTGAVGYFERVSSRGRRDG
jgi:uncharacterized protein